jgi:pectate lyase
MGLVIGWLAAVVAGAEIPAFPGGEGFGSTTPGGRGGTVILVTNLDDSGPGSFRAACEAEGPRIVVFRVGGTIALRKPLYLKNPYITIAGQSAPGGGICLRNAPSNEYANILIVTHDVIIRHMRFRPGPSRKPSSIIDAVAIEHGARNVILDHCSMGWSVDECLQFWTDPQDVTVQWCFITEGLNKSVHPLGAHSKGVLIGTKGCKRISIHHSLIAHFIDRSPRIGCDGIVDFVNNVIYDPEATGHLGDSNGKQFLNYVGNFVKVGPHTRKLSEPRYAIYTDKKEPTHGYSIYVKGNIGPHRPKDDGPEDAVVRPVDRKYVVAERHEAAAVTTTSAAEAYERVLAEAGATLPTRDAVDTRIVREVKTGTGRIIDSPADVGGWPELEAGTPPEDRDRDGMPDAWERKHGLDPANGDDHRGDLDGDGYTNIEEYLNGTNPREKEGAGGHVDR